MSKYRVVKITSNGFSTNPQPTEEVYWEGNDLLELSKKFPKSNVTGADRLGAQSIEDGWIGWHYRFEKLEGEKWQEINDPRRKVYSPEQEELEAAIDEENRRLFPGDFITEDDYYDDDYDRY